METIKEFTVFVFGIMFFLATGLILIIVTLSILSLPVLIALKLLGLL